jgi:hypothetical protein
MQAVADRALHAYAEASPHYRGVVPEHLYRHMAHTCREVVRLYVRMVRQQREPREDELRLFRERAGERGAEGLPVAELLQAYFFIAEAIWEELSEAAEGDLPPEAGRMLLSCVHRLAYEGVQAHQEQSQDAHSEEREAMRELVRALVTGEPATEFAARSEIRLVDTYAVLALGFGGHPAESVGDAVGRRLAGHRKVHQLTGHLRRELRRELRDDVLAALDPDGGLVLMPATTGRPERDLATVRALIPRLQELTGIAITCGHATAADIASIPAVAERARKLLRLARPGQVAVLDDHLFEYQLCHESDALPHLISIVERLRGEPDLMDTLTTYFASDFNRRETARRLHVHPNTVDNRLSRIATVTDANPRTARGLMVLGAALALPVPG